jgi:hypothetical protein
MRIAGIRYTTVPNTHISAPAITWSSNGEMLRSGGVEAYVRYRTRSQNTRNAPSAPPGRVPKNKYRGVDHRGHRASLGKGSTTGHQNRSDVAKKHACSTSCQGSDRSANSNAAGICHPISAAVAAAQQNAGWVRKLATHCNGVQESTGPTMLWTIHLGNPRRSGSSGAPSRTNGGATAMSSMCCSI